MNANNDRGIHVAPGNGIIAHLGNFVAFATGDDTGLNQLIVRLNALADAEWPEIVRTITSDIAASGYSSHPHVACASVEENKVRALVYGEMQLHVRTDGESQILDGSESSTWVDVAVKGSVERMMCGSQTDSLVVGVLRDGVVPGGGFLLDVGSPIPAATRWDHAELHVVPDEPTPVDHIARAEVEPEPAEVIAVVEEPAEVLAVVEEDAEPLHADAVSDEVEEMEEADEISDNSGTMASLHAIVNTETDADTASEELIAEVAETPEDVVEDLDDVDPNRPVVTGLFRSRMDRQDEGRETEPQGFIATSELPKIGVLTFDDGAALQLVRPVVIGRGVPERYLIDEELATTVLLDDTQGLISNVHLEIRIRDNYIELRDKHSVNGTFIYESELDERIQLTPEEPVLVKQGTRVELGQRSFTFTLPSGE